MGNKQITRLNQTHSCRCCGLVGHELAPCGYTGLVSELSLPGMVDLPEPWKILTPRQASKLRLVSKDHAKPDAKQVGVCPNWGATHGQTLMDLAMQQL